MTQGERDFTPSADFVFPTFAEWQQRLRTISDVHQQLSGSESAAMFSRISVLLGESLRLPSHQDYYRPERAALVLETIKLLSPEDKIGSIAYVLNATDQGSLVGAEISRGVLTLSNWLNIHMDIANKIEGVLKSKDFDQVPSQSAALVQEWLNQGSGQPLAVWLRTSVERTQA